MPTLVKPHGGGPLKPLLLHGAALAHEGKRALSLPRIPVTSREKGELLMLGIGGFTPLAGFMTHADWQGVCSDYRTADGLFWPIPITLSASRPLADPIRINDEVALMDAESGSLLATMTVTEKYSIDKAHECKSVFRTTDIDHPGVKMVMEQGEVNLAGPLKVISEGGFREKYGMLYMTRGTRFCTPSSGKTTAAPISCWDAIMRASAITTVRSMRITSSMKFCITIDREAREYLPHMYGAVNWTLVDDVTRLPVKVAEIYRRLTT